MVNVVYDSHEVNCNVPNLLNEVDGLTTEQRLMSVGDYQISPDHIFERKTASDFWSSIIDKRIFNQLSELKQYQYPCIILEGSFEDIRGHVDMHLVRSVLLSIAFNYQIPLIPVENDIGTALLIKQAVQRLKRPRHSVIPLQTRRKPRDPFSKEQLIWESFPMIGPGNAKRLTEYEGTLLEKLNHIESIELKGIGKRKKDSIISVLDKDNRIGEKGVV